MTLISDKNIHAIEIVFLNLELSSLLGYELLTKMAWVKLEQNQISANYTKEQAVRACEYIISVIDVKHDTKLTNTTAGSKKLKYTTDQR